MKAPVTLGLYGVGLAAVFVASTAIGAAVIPSQWSEDWMHQIEQGTHENQPTHENPPSPEGEVHE